MIQSTQARGVQASKCTTWGGGERQAANLLLTKSPFLGTDTPAGFGKAAEIN